MSHESMDDYEEERRRAREEIKELTEEINQTDSPRGNLFYNRGLAYNELGEPQKALKDYYKVIEINDDLEITKWSYALIGSLLINLKEFEKTIEVCCEAGKLVGDDESFESRLLTMEMLCYQHLKDYNRLIQRGELCVKKFGGLGFVRAKVHNSLGYGYLMLKNYDKSIFNYEQSIRIRKSFPALRMISFVHTIIGDYKKAMEYANDYISNAHHEHNDILSPMGHAIRGNVYRAMGDLEEARIDFMKIEEFLDEKETDTDCEILCYFLGLYYRDLKDFEKSISWIRRSLEVDPKFEFSVNELNNVLDRKDVEERKLFLWSFLGEEKKKYFVEMKLGNNEAIRNVLKICL